MGAWATLGLYRSTKQYNTDNNPQTILYVPAHIYNSRRAPPQNIKLSMPLLSQVLTEGSGVVIAWTHESQLAQEWHELLRRALVDALPLSERVQVVEHLEESSARLVDRADDGAASAR